VTQPRVLTWLQTRGSLAAAVAASSVYLTHLRGTEWLWVWRRR
jgi:hypothetical protein